MELILNDTDDGVGFRTPSRGFGRLTDYGCMAGGRVSTHKDYFFPMVLQLWRDVSRQ